MKWVAPAGPLPVPPVVLFELLSRRLDAEPEDPALISATASAAESVSQWPVALRLYERGLSMDPDNLLLVAGRGRSLWQLGDPSAALPDFERACVDRPDDAVLMTWLGRALERTGRTVRARAVWTEATQLSNSAVRAARSLLRQSARSGNGALVLTQCADLPPVYAGSAMVRGYRALGLSMIGDSDGANALVRLDRDVVEIPLETPRGFRDQADFHRVLCAEVERHAYPDAGDSPFPRNDRLDVAGAVAHPALVAGLQDVVERVIGDPLLFGWPSVHAPPTSGRIRTAGTVLSGSLANGTHLHSDAYLSGVYLAKVPAQIAETADDRGALLLGSVRGIADRHEPSWGSRVIRPRVGWVTLFPSHIFHEARPTFLDDTRVSVAFDLVGAHG